MRPSKRVQTLDAQVACDVCGRTMLKGESAEPYLLTSGERRFVCELCAPRAQQEGWIREAANPGMPVQPPRSSEGRRLFRRRRRRPQMASSESEQPEPQSGAGGNDHAPADNSIKALIGRPRRDPRSVRAVPTSAQLKIERAIELFNGSEHVRTVAGIARTLGEPQVSAATSTNSSSEVLLTIAWELSWYKFAVDLADPGDPVRVEGRGDELGELERPTLDWNARLESDGSLALGAAKSDGEDPEETL